MSQTGRRPKQLQATCQWASKTEAFDAGQLRGVAASSGAGHIARLPGDSARTCLTTQVCSCEHFGDATAPNGSGTTATERT